MTLKAKFFRALDADPKSFFVVGSFGIIALMKLKSAKIRIARNEISTNFDLTKTKRNLGAQFRSTERKMR